MRSILTPAVALLALLAACAGTLDEPLAQPAAGAWPPPWQDTPPPPDEWGTPAFLPPTASDCHRPPGQREAVWGGGQSVGALTRREDLALADTGHPPAVAKAESLRRGADTATASVAPAPWPQPQPRPEAPLPRRERPANETVTAGVVDDNADFGEYLAYRERHAGLPVLERDISERYLVEVTDATGRPVHDAEVAVQRSGVAAPLAWARTDTAGHVWLHPRAFLGDSAWPQGRDATPRTLGVAVRKGTQQAQATLVRGARNALQVRLGAVALAARPRLDLVFLVDATGSMGDEIAKLKTSMRAMAQQIAQLPGQPDICWGLVAYRDRGDAFLTRTHDFTDDLGAFQQALGRVQAAGGGDTPEALNEALHEVVHGMSWRADAARLVVLVADAPPHLDYDDCADPGGVDPHRGREHGAPRAVACPRYDLEMQAALAKGIKLFAVGASGLDPVGEYIFRQIAQYTAGRFVFLTYRDAARPESGPGTETVHDVGHYSVQTLDRLVVRLVGDELARLPHA